MRFSIVVYTRWKFTYFELETYYYLFKQKKNYTQESRKRYCEWGYQALFSAATTNFEKWDRNINDQNLSNTICLFRLDANLIFYNKPHLYRWLQVVIVENERIRIEMKFEVRSNRHEILEKRGWQLGWYFGEFNADEDGDIAWLLE